ncbi:hypothetical protein AYW79_02395 [Ferroacidibacillus organovorans]|uniref:Adenosylcobinamide-GDP ribazoletransferase n=1 Tax=Ferroacidibacillus organovorans TaxID=1765683 RepID=A0A853KDH9_9BACL|nr:hypothetical protein AYJ22_13410 [Ferroacidibacillus organovorans]OAG95102.1 hypothetical protein AYW79_02395 [Ferroacidibacillus organovorans]
MPFLRPFLIALQFLTRIPVPDLGPPDDADFRASVRCYPLVGLFIGILTVLFALLLPLLFPSRLLQSVLLVAFDLLITGGLHLDGLMDTADGFLSYRDKARVLDIMRDSRVGAMAVLAVIITLTVRIAALAALPTATRLSVLLVAPFLARGQLLLVIRFNPLARDDGLSRQALDVFDWRDLLPYLVALLLTVWLARLSGFIMALAAGAVAVWLSRVARQRIGGMTGDVYGAAVELAQVATVLAAAVHLP